MKMSIIKDKRAETRLKYKKSLTIFNKFEACYPQNFISF